VTIATLMVGFALFAVVLYYVYFPRHTGAFADDGIHTSLVRRENLAKLHEKEAKQSTSYAWVDQKTGVVQLPLDRAMELTLQKYASKK
jgi:hypothetical protein